MSDWDDFLFYENERLANGGIPIDGDSFNDAPDSNEGDREEVTQEEKNPTLMDVLDQYEHHIDAMLAELDKIEKNRR